MRVKFTFDIPDGKLELPVHYNHAVQSMIYASLSRQLADFLHTRGFPFEKRLFRLFTFSRLSGRYRIYRGGESGHTTIVFSDTVSFYLSSPYEDILQQFATSMLTGTQVILNRRCLFLSSVEVLTPPVLNHTPCRVKMLSPLVIRSTLYTPEGTKKTYYYSPLEAEFSPLIARNLLKKYQAFYHCLPDNTAMEIRPHRFSPERNRRQMSYKGFAITAWDGIYELSGSAQLIRFGWDCGLGERSSQGFGMFEPWKEKSD